MSCDPESRRNPYQAMGYLERSLKNLDEFVDGTSHRELSRYIRICREDMQQLKEAMHLFEADLTKAMFRHSIRLRQASDELIGESPERMRWEGESHVG